MSTVSANVATLGAFFSLVRVLHAKKVIHIDELISQIGDTIDFADMKHMENPTKDYSLQIYKSLQEIAAALAAADK
jgi:hypothetical protein